MSRRPVENAPGTLRGMPEAPHREGLAVSNNGQTALELRYDIDGEEFRVVVDDAEFSIGRSPNCSLTLSDDSVSRRHARITTTAEGWTIHDLESKNGIKVNTYRSEQQRLRDGDRIDVGGVRLYVRIAAPRPTAIANVVFEADVDKRHHTEIIDVAHLDSLLSPGMPDPSDSSPLIAVANEFDESEPGLRLFSDAAEALISCETLDETLDRILQLVFDNLPAERGVICLYDEETRTTTPQVMRTRAGSSDEPIRISSHIANDVITRKASLLVNDPLRDERFGGAESVIMLNIRSAMCAPLYRQGRVVGFVYVDRQNAQDPFTTAHLHALSTLGILSAIAVEQSLLRDGLRREQDIRTRLTRYSSPAVVDRIIADTNQSATMATDEADVTVVFADLTGFTSMAEALAPAETVRVLNQVFERLTEGDLRVRGHARQVPRRRHDGVLRRAAAAARPRAARRGRFGANAGAARRAQLVLARPSDPDAHRHQLGRGRGRRHRLPAAQGLHRDRRRREHGQPSRIVGRPARRGRDRRRNLGARARTIRLRAARARPAQGQAPDRPALQGTRADRNLRHYAPRSFEPEEPP